MSDRVNNELLSAYLDDEVTAEDRTLVEQALVDSAETRMSLESLRQVQARVRSIPRLSLPADFHERVLREAERRASDQSVATRTVEETKWMRLTAVVATVAAVLLVALLFANRNRDSEIVEKHGPDGTEVVQPDPSLPGNEVLVAAGPRPQPEYIMVLDLAITKKGQENDVFEMGLQNAGIAFDARDEGVVLGDKLRSKLLKTRFVAGVDQPAAGNERFDVVDMVYIHATGAQVDELFQRMRHDQEVRTVLDLALLPESTQVLNSLGERVWSLATAEAAGKPKSYAYRMNVGITLHSTRSGFFAKFPTPGLDIRVLENNTKSGSRTGFNFPIPIDFGDKRSERGPANDNAGNVSDNPISEILVIRRNLDAGFPRNAQKPNPN